MKVISTKIKDLLIIEPDVFGDQRGFFMESYNQEKYQSIGLKEKFVQDNLSQSAKGVLRGLHLQKNPFGQGKLVQVIKGAVLDVAVDARPQSPTYGQWESVELNEGNKKQFWIPAGFLHGFLSLKDETIFFYKCTEFYHPEAEVSVLWNDPDLKIDWQLEKYDLTQPLVSSKDQEGFSFQEFSKIIKK